MKIQGSLWLLPFFGHIRDFTLQQNGQETDHPAPMWKPFSTRVEGNLWTHTSLHLRSQHTSFGVNIFSINESLKAVFFMEQHLTVWMYHNLIYCVGISMFTIFFFIDKAMINVFVHKSLKMFPHHFRGRANNFVAFWQLKTIFFLI